MSLWWCGRCQMGGRSDLGVIDVLEQHVRDHHPDDPKDDHEHSR